MSENEIDARTPVRLDAEDRKILRVLQEDATLPMERIGKKVGLSKTAVWNRVQRLNAKGVIVKQMALLNPDKAGFPETFFVAVKTNSHDAKWLAEFKEIVLTMPEIMEAYRMAGDTDYLLKVQTASTRDFDTFYKKLVSQIYLYNVTSNISMETLKYNTALPV